MLGSGTSWSANQPVSTFTQTLPVSTGTSRSVPSSRAKSSAPSGIVTSESAKTPASRARLAKVLSTPKATSPVGESWVSTSLLVNAPASPLERRVSSKPVSLSKARSSFLGRVNESCVTRTTSVGTLPGLVSEDSSSADGSGSPPASEQAEATRAMQDGR